MSPSRHAGAEGEQDVRDADVGPSRPTPRWPRRRLALAGGGLLALAMLVGLLVLLQEPSFYREARAGGDLSTVEAMARRMLSKAAALHAVAGRQGPWEAVIRADEANAWLATDLPRNHRSLLPPGLDTPRVAFLSNRVQLGARLRLGPISSIAWIDAEPRLKGVNQVGLTINAAGLGWLPLPRGALLHQMARQLARAGLVTDLLQHEGRPMLVVSPSATYDSSDTSCRLELMAVETGELLVAGATRRISKGVDRE